MKLFRILLVTWVFLNFHQIKSIPKVNCLNKFSAAVTPNQKIDSLKNALLSLSEDSLKINTLNVLSEKQWRKGDYGPGMLNAEKAKYLSEKLNYKKGLAQSLFNIGTIYKEQSNFSKALENNFKALKIYEDIRSKEGIGITNNIIGLIYREHGNYPKSLEHFLKALRVREEIGDKKGIAGTFNNLGIIYRSQGDFSKALEYYNKALVINKAMDNKAWLAINLNGIGSIYADLGKTSKVTATQLDYCEKSLNNFLMLQKISEESGNKFLLASALGNVGGAYQRMGLIANNISLRKAYFNKALECYLNSLRVAIEIGSRDVIATAYGNLGSLNYHLKKFKEAKTYMLQALAISKETRNLDRVKDNYHKLSEIDSTIGMWKDAFTNRNLSITYRDSLVNEENTKKNVRAEMNFDFEKKEHAAKIEQDKKDLIVREEKQKQKIIIAAISTGLFLVLILALVIFKNLRQNQMKNRIITEQKKMVESQKHLVEEKQKELLDSITYARRIQRALITNEKYIHKNIERLTNLK